MELWRCIPSLPEYMASSEGRVMRVPFIGTLPNGAQRLYGFTTSFGHASEKNDFRPNINVRGKKYRVSRLICEAFHGPAPFDGAVTMHEDDDTMNNKASNLSWGSQKQNLNAPSFLLYCKSRVGEESPVIKGRRNSL